MKATAGALLVAAALGAGHAAAAPQYALVDLGTLGGPGSYGAAVSDTGIVVGCSDVMPNGVRAFIYRDGAMRELGSGDSAPGNSCALAVNASGAAAGRSTSGELVIWNGASITRLGVRGDVGAISDAGVVVGGYGELGRTRPFMYSAGSLTDLGSLGGTDGSGYASALNAKGQIVGTSNGRAFVYEGGTMRDLGSLGGNNSAARGINARGDIVGMSANELAQPTPFIHSGAMQALPGPAYSGAVAINNKGQVVGSAEGTYGYLIEGDEVTRLSTLPAVVAKGWRKLVPTGINERGWIVGTGTTAEGDSRAFLLVPTANKLLRLPR
ncbi:MAG TPA: hypothetical protein VFK48_15865 [Usitatibacter sp.]|nr:hypothetical protein [Usitatibacter sp.]